MPVLANPKHELFAQALARGSDKTAAYVSAGYEGKAAGKSAWKLANRAHISARVGELVQQFTERDRDAMLAAAKELQIEKSAIITELWMNATQPDRDKRDIAASNRALELLGKEIHNMFVEKIEHGRPGEFGLPREAREAKELLDRIRAEKAVPKAPPPVVAPRKQDA